MTQPTTLQSLDSILSAIRDDYGPCVIAPPADRKSPVAILLPLAVRYCITCQAFKPVEAMLTADHCQECLGSTPALVESQTSD